MAYDDDDYDDPYENGFDHHAEVVTVQVENDRAFITIEMDDGSVVHIGEHGGVSFDWIQDFYDLYGEDWADAMLDEMWDKLYG